MMAGAMAAGHARIPLMKRIPADAPGCDAAGPGVADDAAGRVLPAVHRPVVPHVLRPGLRFLRAVRERTVCGILTGAGLSRLWPHDRAHRFFSRARWNPDDLGILAAKLATGLLVGDGEPVEVLIDDTLFHGHLPVVLRHRCQACHHHPHPRQIENRIQPGPRHHGKEIHAIQMAWEDAEDLAA
jgi:hypothetical protein